MRSTLPLRSIASLLAIGCVAFTPGCQTRIRTTHYLAVFDPVEQMPQEVYRVRITGDSNVFSNVKYGSGWVPAEHADLLTTAIQHDDDGKIQVTTDGQIRKVDVRAHRRFFEIGPFGVSPEPEDARFVVVMSSNPDYFFQKIAALAGMGEAGPAELEKAKQALLKEILTTQLEVAKEEQAVLDQLTELAKGSGGAQ